jgi:multidrug resistance efflux pump
LLADSNWSDVPYSRQRLDEIAIRLAGLHNDEGALIATIGEIEAKYAAETTRIARLSREALVAPVDGVVWRSWVAPGAAVVHGTPLMEVIDCDHIYVEATTRERFFESLRPGQPVRVRLEGSGKDVPGTIRSVVGPGAPLATTANVSAINRRNGTEAQLVVDVDRSALSATAGSTCNVGRSAKVYFG